MAPLIRHDFMTVRQWHSAPVGGDDVVLRGVSALEHLGYFTGWIDEKTIDVYAKAKGGC